MSIERKLIPCEPDDPHRCQAKGDIKEGQCPFTAVEGEIYCPKHNGTQMQARKALQRVHDYRLQIWQERVTEFSESENVRSLKGEIGILRLMIEQILNKCTDSSELVIYSGRISDLIVKLDKLMNSMNTFDTKMGMMLDKTAAITLASRVVDVISKHITEPTVVDAISSGIIDILSELGSKPIINDN